jgi:hypothetical protein
VRVTIRVRVKIRARVQVGVRVMIRVWLFLKTVYHVSKLDDAASRK